MKSLRRSLNNNNNGNTGNGIQPLASPPLPNYANPLNRPSEKVAPPQKVIKALVSHRSTNAQELSYTEGDFWYVTGEREGWFEALSASSASPSPEYWRSCVSESRQALMFRSIDEIERASA